MTSNLSTILDREYEARERYSLYGNGEPITVCFLTK
jgi:hypothetical protein